MKHIPTVLEPSIPCHTLVKLVDAEDIAHDIIRTHDLTFEVNNVTKNFKNKRSIHHNQINLCLNNLETLITKLSQHTKKLFLLSSYRSPHFSFFSESNEMRKNNEKLMLDQNFLKIVQIRRTLSAPSNDRTKRHDTRYRSRSTSRNNNYKTNNITQNRYRSTLEIDSVMIQVLLLHKTLVHDMIIINEVRDHIAPLIDLHTNHPIDVTLVTGTDNVHILEKTILHALHLLTDHLQD